ncbi:hypothetical protein [Massilia consociata]|uniref:Lipoprotein n=1 Tax=Massilia consociata TaxID=760117 RepID=A0ABV6FDT7_9BURK
MKKIVFGAAIAVLLSACASSSVILVGHARPAIQPSAVKLYLEPPASYERIALLETSSEASWAVTNQGKTDKMVERLKEEAAKLGANGVLLTATGNKQEPGAVFVPVTTGGAVILPANAEHKSGTGIAIFVSRE